jgi:hypothetical protein
MQARSTEEQVARREELMNLTLEYKRHVDQWNQMSTQLDEWSDLQQIAMSEAVERTVEEVKPQALQSLQSMVAVAVSELQNLLQNEATQHQEQITKQAGGLSLALLEAQNETRSWLATFDVHVRATETLMEAHTRNFLAIQDQSTHLVKDLVATRAEAQDLSLVLEKNVAYIDQMHVGTRETVEIISHAISLLNHTAHDQKASHDSFLADFVILQWKGWLRSQRGHYLLIVAHWCRNHISQLMRE